MNDRPDAPDGPLWFASNDWLTAWIPFVLRHRSMSQVQGGRFLRVSYTEDRPFDDGETTDESTDESTDDSLNMSAVSTTESSMDSFPELSDLEDDIIDLPGPHVNISGSVTNIGEDEEDAG